MTYTKRFDEIGRDDLSLAGGKGANLGELSRAGLPVPPGFVVTTGAYDDFVEAGELGTRSSASRRGRKIRRAGGSGGGDPRSLRPNRGSGGRGQGDPVAYRAGRRRRAVAARSSATTEDLPGASFAGQQETHRTCAAKRRYSKRSRTAGPVSGRRGRWPTVPARA